MTLRLVAQYADAWNSFGPPANYAAKSAVLDEWCAKLDRNPREVERTAALQPDEVGNWAEYLDAGAEHLIVMAGAPVRPRSGRGAARVAVARSERGGRTSVAAAAAAARQRGRVRRRARRSRPSSTG